MTIDACLLQPAPQPAGHVALAGHVRHQRPRFLLLLFDERQQGHDGVLDGHCPMPPALGGLDLACALAERLGDAHRDVLEI
ncbi:MAG TPA: hypothetical protein VIK01_15765 [Polyangiaceae bacterium]